MTASRFLEGNMEAELKPTTFSSLLPFRVFLSFLFSWPPSDIVPLSGACWGYSLIIIIIFLHSLYEKSHYWRFGAHQRLKKKKKEKNKWVRIAKEKGNEAQRVKPLTSTWEIDALKGEEEHTGKRRKNKKKKKVRQSKIYNHQKRDLLSRNKILTHSYGPSITWVGGLTEFISVLAWEKEKKKKKIEYFPVQIDIITSRY